MSVRAVTSTVAYLPFADEDTFLRNTADVLERLRAESERRGHNLLGSLISIAKGEAEDGIRTQATDMSILARDQEHDDGVEKMAQRFAFRVAGNA